MARIRRATTMRFTGWVVLAAIITAANTIHPPNLIVVARRTLAMPGASSWFNAHRSPDS